MARKLFALFVSVLPKENTLDFLNHFGLIVPFSFMAGFSDIRQSLHNFDEMIILFESKEF